MRGLLDVDEDGEEEVGEGRSITVSNGARAGAGRAEEGWVWVWVCEWKSPVGADETIGWCCAAVVLAAVSTEGGMTSAFPLLTLLLLLSYLAEGGETYVAG